MQRVVMTAALGDTETGCSTPRENAHREAGHLSLGFWASDKPFQQKRATWTISTPPLALIPMLIYAMAVCNARTHTTGSGLTGPGSGNPVLIAVIAGTVGGDMTPMSEVWEGLAHKFKVTDNEGSGRHANKAH